MRKIIAHLIQTYLKIYNYFCSLNLGRVDLCGMKNKQHEDKV